VVFKVYAQAVIPAPRDEWNMVVKATCVVSMQADSRSIDRIGGGNENRGWGAALVLRCAKFLRALGGFSQLFAPFFGFTDKKGFLVSVRKIAKWLPKPVAADATAARPMTSAER
jgi:hypothetical protein